MRLASKGGIGWWERERFRWFRLRKRVYQRLKFQPHGAKTVLFIVGCQRSGTSMLSHLFRLDWQAVTYDEVSPLSSRDPEGLRLDPLPDVQSRIAADRAALVVCKPLVESQNIQRLLTEFPGSRAIWMYRGFRDVAQSNLKFFGHENGHRDLAPLLAGEQSDWRAEGMAAADLAELRRLAAVGLSAADAAALFWWARNTIYFNCDLMADNRVALCEYDELTRSPGAVMAAAYAHLGIPYPGDRIIDDVFTGSRGRGSNLELTADVEALCEQMLARLRNAAGKRLSASRQG